MNVNEKAVYIIENNQIMTVATADSNGKPWISPVGFMQDEHLNLYWVSDKDALHSQNVRNRPEVAIVILGKLPDGELDGVYIDAVARELSTEEEIVTAIAVLASREEVRKFIVNSAADVSGKAAWRIYKAEPVSVSKRANATINGQAVTVREPVELRHQR